jgi:UDP:flavonoid glycosyltransferase YjiC (YdhE family)
MVDALFLDPPLSGPINEIRAELDLLPVRRVLHEWRHSPQLVLGLFPPWFAAPQPDWPSCVRLTGFLNYDAADTVEVPAEVKRFLASGPPPVVVTAGSAVRRAHQFFQESTHACRLSGCRALLLTRYPEQVPSMLPPGIRHVDYLPLSRLLHRCAALVHCGGIGTAAAALSAGIPQLVMPLKNDQPENARRLEELGAATVLSPRSYRAPAVARALEQLLQSPTTANRCHTLAGRLDQAGYLEETCRLIEHIDNSAAPDPIGIQALCGDPVALHTA